METIICPKCGKEVSGNSIYCSYCGCPISREAGSGKEQMSGTRRIKRNNMILMIGIIAVVMLGIVIFAVLKPTGSKEYCEGLRWGSSVRTVEKKYPDWTYDEDNSYFDLVDSLDGYHSEGDMIDMNFCFDENDKLEKIEASIVSEDIGDAILYYVGYFNKIYDEDYEATYNTKYRWYGDKTNISMTATDVLLVITYEDAK